jgi:hypothetical protein
MADSENAGAVARGSSMIMVERIPAYCTIMSNNGRKKDPRKIGVLKRLGAKRQ